MISISGGIASSGALDFLLFVGYGNQIANDHEHNKMSAYAEEKTIQIEESGRSTLNDMVKGKLKKEMKYNLFL